MSKNKLELLYEALKDMAKDTDTVHYTDLYGLIGILRDGKLKAQNYRDKAKENTVEVAALRRSRDKPLQALSKKDPSAYADKMSELSSNIGFVKIYLHSNRIKSGVRGVKKSPISEFYKFNVREFNESSEELIKIFDKCDVEITKEKLKEIVKKGLERIVSVKGIDKVNDFIRKDYNEEIKKVYHAYGLKIINADKHNMFETYFQNLFNQGRYLFYSQTMGKEAEERFSFSKKAGKDLNNVGIPVNPLYMKIRIISPSDWFEKEDVIAEDFIKELKKLKTNIGKYEDVFLKDKNFFKFKKELDDIINRNTK